LQDEPGVAGDAAAEVVRQSRHRVERHRGNRVGPADAGREYGHRVPQQVDVGVALRQHAFADPRVHPHGPGRRRPAARRDDAPPQSAGGPQLGDRQKVVGAEAHAKQDLPGGRIDIEPGRGHGPQVGDGGGHAERDILSGGRPGVVIGRGADADGGHVREVRRRPRRQVGQQGQAGCGRHRQLTVARQDGQRVGVERPLGRRGRYGVPSPQGHQQGRRREERRAGFERHTNLLQGDAGQSRVEILDVIGHQPVTPGQDRGGRCVGVQAATGGEVEPQQQ
jgi:hypothetical protein